VAAARAFGVEGVDGAVLEGRQRVLQEAASLSVSVWMATWISMRSATVRQLSMAAGVEPQSSCSFRPMAPARICSSSGSGRLTLPLPRKPRFIGKASAAPASNGCARGPGVQVVAAVPTAGPVPPPIMVVTPLISFLDLLRADEVDVAVDAAGGDDHAFAGDDFGRAADGDVTPGWMSGLPALPMAGDRAA
jgi:hypothetical protein